MVLQLAVAAFIALCVSIVKIAGGSTALSEWFSSVSGIVGGVLVSMTALFKFQSKMDAHNTAMRQYVELSNKVQYLLHVMTLHGIDDEGFLRQL